MFNRASAPKRKSPRGEEAMVKPREVEVRKENGKPRLRNGVNKAPYTLSVAG